MRLFQTLVALLLICIMGGPRSSSLTPIIAGMIAIVSVPVTFQADDVTRTRAGRLTLLAGWKLSSRSPQFGGWSALDIDGDRVTAIGDYGSVLRFRLTRFGRAVDARIDPLPVGCGRFDQKRERDSESLTRAPGGWWIGYEVDGRLCRVDADFTRASALNRPGQMADWRRAGGAEAIVRLADGRLLVFAERPPIGTAPRPLLVFKSDPSNVPARAVARSYVPPEGFSPTDAAQLPDGRILVLNRRFAFADRFTSILTVFDLAALDSAKPVTGVPIARLAPPTLHDNFEGLAVTVEKGRAIVWMISDDNFMVWQDTYLLKFALNAGRPQAKPAKRD